MQNNQVHIFQVGRPWLCGLGRSPENPHGPSPLGFEASSMLATLIINYIIVKSLTFDKVSELQQ